MKKLRLALVIGFARLLRVPVRLSVEEYWWGLSTEASNGRLAGRQQRRSGHTYSNQQRGEAG